MPAVPGCRSTAHPPSTGGDSLAFLLVAVVTVTGSACLSRSAAMPSAGTGASGSSPITVGTLPAPGGCRSSH